MDILHYIILILGGVFGGFANVLIGGGGLIILPVYMGVGLPASVANGTNRVNSLIQNSVALYRFSKTGKMRWRLGFILSIPTVIGAIVGALSATNISDAFLHILLLVIIVFSFFYILFKMDITPRKPVKSTAPINSVKVDWITLLLCVGIGFYAGFISVGVGMLWYALFNWRLKIGFVKILAVKVLLNLLVGTIAFIIFAIAHKVNYTDGLILSIGSAIGAWLSTTLSMKLNRKSIRNMMLFMLVGAAIYILFFKVLNLF